MESSSNSKFQNLLIIFTISSYIIISPTTAHDLLEAVTDAAKAAAENTVSAIANAAEVAAKAANDANAQSVATYACAPTGSDLSYRDEFLKAHNEVRGRMNEPPLTWDSDLEEYARNYGEQQAEDCVMQHSNGPYGENLFEGGGSMWTPRDAVTEWIKEDKSYDMGHNTCQPGQMCGHYTQIIWKSSCRLGCARILCKNGDTFAICEYDPPGNYVGEKPLDGVQHNETNSDTQMI